VVLLSKSPVNAIGIWNRDKVYTHIYKCVSHKAMSQSPYIWSWKRVYALQCNAI